MKKIHLAIEISGRVQGVGFRAGAAHKARQLGVTGWVKNSEDGKVVMEVEGIKSQVDEFVSWCKQGPMLAKVEEVKINSGKVVNYDDFSIRKN